MAVRGKILIVVVAVAFGVMAPGIASAQISVISGSLEVGDPTFHRPSTSFPPCNLSSSGTAVYYDVYTVDHPGGLVSVSIEGTVDLMVLASYPEGMFNPASPCDDILGVGGCFSSPAAFDAPIFATPGIYEFVVTTCYNGDGGDYTITSEVYIFKDGFESSDTSAWSVVVE